MQVKSGSQLPLNLNLDSETRFQNFFEFGMESEIVKELKGEFSMVYLWGGAGSGRTHLLQAVTYEAYAKREPSIFLPLKKADNYSPEILSGIEGVDVVCLDDIQAIARDLRWEEAIFRLYNYAQETKCKLVISADRAPQNLPMNLADLKSRLCSFPVFMLHSPDEKAQLEILRYRAKLRGVKLENDVLNFISKNMRRGLHEIIDLLEKLDVASKIEKRKITIPLIKKVKNW